MQIEPFSDDTPLYGDNAPPAADQIDDLLRFLVTIRKRFGNTAVRYYVNWGSRGLHVHDDQKQEIARLREGLELLKQFSEAHHCDQQSHVFLHALTVDIPHQIECLLSETSQD